jgi:hypothetical protein
MGTVFCHRTEQQNEKLKNGRTSVTHAEEAGRPSMATNEDGI